jgi:N,N'-diacetylchitobiose phosphorylase
VEAAFRAAARKQPLPGVLIRPQRAHRPTRFSPATGEGSQIGLPAIALPHDEPLQFWNGYGGFSADGAEYVIRLQPEASGRLRLPPLPWVNVVANPHFGFLASETGAGYTWSQNSRENRLTPWSNDPILDPHGEALYLRDEDSGAVWSLQPGPIPQPVPYEVRHGFGYSHYRHVSQGLEATGLVCSRRARTRSKSP